MYITMDRYEANWSMVEQGWHTHVLGEGQQFDTAPRGNQDAARQSIPAPSTRICRRS